MRVTTETYSETVFPLIDQPPGGVQSDETLPIIQTIRKAMIEPGESNDRTPR